MFGMRTNKVLAFILIFAMVIGFMPVLTQPVNAAADPWDGTSDTAWYTTNPAASSFTINTAEQLAGLATLVNGSTDTFSGDTITLAGDLDLAGHNWVPIGDGVPSTDGFEGTFDGGGHIISNMTIGSAATPDVAITNAGLFGYAISPVFRNIIIKDASVYLSASGVRAGMLAGNVSTGATVINCGSSGTLVCSYGTSNQRVGGLVGYVSNPVLHNSYSSANCSGSSSSARVGGLIGEANTGLVISNCYATGNVTSGNTFVGGIIGYYTSTSTTSSYVYWNSDATHTINTGTPAEKKAVGSSQTLSDTTSKTSDDMKSAAFVTLLNDHRGAYSSWTAVSDSYPAYAPPDTTAPNLTAGAVNRTSDTEGTVKFTSNEAGSYYYSVVADGAGAPAIDTSGGGTVCTTSETTITNPTGLTAGAKSIYIKVKDAAGNVSAALKIDIPDAGPSTLKTVDFDSFNSDYTITGEVTPNSSYCWARTDGTVISPDTAFSGQQGTYYFYAENTDGTSGNSQVPVYVTLNSIDVTEYADLEIKILIAGNNSTGSALEGGEYLRIQYSYNGGSSYTSLAQFIPSVANATCYTEDANADGTTDGANLSPTFTEYTYSIPKSGSNLLVRIAANSDQGGEEVGFDNIRITGEAAAGDTTAPILTAGAVSRTSDTEGTVKFTSDEAGSYYYVVVADGAAAPVVDSSGAGTACTTAETTIADPTGLTAGAKDIYIKVKDAAGNISAALKMDIAAYVSPDTTVLNPGDIVIVAINGDVDDPNSYGRGFSFMPLVNLAEGTVIYFTDYGWSDSTNAFITNISIADAFIHYTAPAGGITAGTVIRCDSYQHSNFTFDYTYSGVGTNPYLNTGGLSNSDELLVFTGDRSTPTFIFAVTYVTTGWAINVGSNGTDASGAGSALPPGLTDDQTALSFNQPSGANDNSSYSGATTAANKADWQDRIRTYSNWSFNDVTPIPTPPVGPLPVLGVNAAPIASNVQASGTLNVGQPLTGSYTYNDADGDAQGTSTFIWYRSDNAAGLNRAPIAGQTTTSYTLTTDDLGKYISFEVTPVASTGTTPGAAVESTRIGPVTKILTVTATADNKTYNASTAATGTITLDGVLGADAAQVTASGTFAFADASAGDGKTVNVTGITLAGAKSGNYTLNGVTTANTTANIIKKPLTASASANSKSYDGNTTATGSIALATVEGADAGQVTANGTFAFEDADVANGKTVNVTGISLAGAKAGNYTLNNTTDNTTANIIKANIAGITFSNSTVTYDGTAKTLTITGTLPTGASVAYVTNTGTNAGTYNATANITGGTNYNDTSLNATLTINKANIAGITFNNLTVPYDGSEKSVVISGTLPTGASVAYVSNTGTNAGTYNATANISGGANYNDTSLNATLTIQKVQLTATVGNDTKAYGEDNPAFTVGVTGFVNGEDEGTAAGYTAPAASSLATATTDVGAAAITISGGTATNYSFDISDTGVLTINPKVLTVTATANNKTYNRSAAATGTINLTGIVGADAGQVTASGTFAFEDALVGNDKRVNVTGIALAGARSGNYTLNGVTSTSDDANITAKTLTFTVSANGKAYDGNATATGTINLTGVEVGDTVTASGTFAFLDAAVGVGKTVNVSGITLGGADAGNYTLNGVTGSTTATITKQVQSIAVLTLPTKTAYAYGEALDVAGGIVTITYTDTTTETTALTDGMCQVEATPAIGVRVVNVTYLTKTATFSVTYTKASQVAPAAPTLSVTASGIAVTAPVGAQYQYSRDGGTNWQSGVNFTGLTHNTAYTITARLKETSTHNASAASAGTNATFLDITAPTLTAGAVVRTSDTAGSVKFTSNEAGQYYYAIVADNAAEPAIVINGAGTNCTTAETTVTNPTGLAAGTRDIYIKVKDAAGNVSNALKIDIAAYVAPSSGNSDPAPTPTPTPTSAPVIVIVNGEEQAAASATTETVGDQTVTTVTVDDKKVEEKLEKEGNQATVVIPVNNQSDVVVGELNGQTVKSMENKEAVLEIKTENVTYTLPAAEINIDDVSAQIGQQVELKDIKVKVTIAELPADTVKIVESTADRNSYQVVVKPVEFNITCTSGDKTVEVSRFNGYVERMVAVPNGIDPSKITTGIVLNNDGTFSHVPTSIVVIGGKYFAKINSLTNSVYSVIWNPMTFADVVGYGATGDAINDMGSRLIISGIGNNNFAPERDITRAEFSVIIVKALGLKPVSGKSSFSDVADTAGYAPFIQTAYEYGIISGYGNGKFGPDDKITREQAMTMIGNAMKITKLNVNFAPGEVDKLLAAYSDSGNIISWGRQSMAACIKAGIISGRGNMTLAPKAYITRAEVAIIVRKLLVKSGLI